MSRKKDTGIRHVYMGFGLLAVLVIVFFDALSFDDNSIQSGMHSAPSSYVVCHEEGSGNSEHYYCSVDGCIARHGEKISLVASYENSDTCSGIADRLQEGVAS